jgi:hypothetical protein
MLASAGFGIALYGIAQTGTLPLDFKFPLNFISSDASHMALDTGNDWH